MQSMGQAGLRQGSSGPQHLWPGIGESLEGAAVPEKLLCYRGVQPVPSRCIRREEGARGGLGPKILSIKNSQTRFSQW